MLCRKCNGNYKVIVADEVIHSHPWKFHHNQANCSIIELRSLRKIPAIVRRSAPQLASRHRQRCYRKQFISKASGIPDNYMALDLIWWMWRPLLIVEPEPECLRSRRGNNREMRLLCTNRVSLERKLAAFSRKVAAIVSVSGAQS